MKFDDGIRHMNGLGLAAVMPNGELHPLSKKLRHPRGIVPVRVLKKGALPKELRDMIRQSRAEARNSRRAGKNG